MNLKKMMQGLVFFLTSLLVFVFLFRALLLTASPRMTKPKTAAKDIEKLLVKKERNVIGIATEVVGDRGLLKKIKSPFENNRSIPTDKELRTDHDDQLKDNRSKQEAFFVSGQPSKGTL